MTLTGEAASIYALSLSFLTLSLQMKAPSLTAISMLLTIFVSTYYAMASKELKKIDERYFSSTLLVLPNPTTIDSEATIRVAIGTMRENVPVEVRIETSSELDVKKDELKWSGIIGRNKGVELSFRIACKKVGMYRIGPLKLIVRDPLGIAAREFCIHQPILLVVTRTSKIRIQPITASITTDPIIGRARNFIIGSDYEYKTSIPELSIAEAKQIDWKKTAKTGGEILYLKRFDKLGRSDLNLCLGSGLDTTFRDGRCAEEILIEAFLEIIYSHLREGGDIFLTKYERGRYVASVVKNDFGILSIMTLEDIPSHALTLYVTSLKDKKEKAALKKLATRLRSQPRLMYLSYGRDPDEIREHLSFLFENIGFHTIVKSPDELSSSLRRILTRLRWSP